jgi:UTP--glucose-1-phosphate uridylyltransferase
VLKETFPVITLERSDYPYVRRVVHAVFEQLHKAGVRRFCIGVGRGKRAMQDHFNPDSRFLDFLGKRGKAAERLCSFYDKLRTSSLASQSADANRFRSSSPAQGPLVKGRFLVQTADEFILSVGDRYLDRFAVMHRKHSVTATVLLEDVPDLRRRGVVGGNFLKEGVFRMTSGVEKSKVPGPITR